MSKQQRREALGRQHVWVVELTVPTCSKVFAKASPAPGCGAVAGQVPCYNTEASCRVDTRLDPAYAYDGAATRTYRFMSPQDNTPNGYFPFITGVSVTPSEINPMGGIGTRSAAVIQMLDAPSTDLSTDPYRDQRPYDPYSRGTFWGKFLARHPYHSGAQIKVRSGYLVRQVSGGLVYDDTSDNVLTYIVDTIKQSSDGSVSIVAKDPLKLADEDRAVAPAAPLDAINQDISATHTGNVAVVGDELFLDYQGTLYARLDDEIVAGAFIKGQAFIQIYNRGMFGTVAEAHKGKTKIQPVLRYSNNSAPYIIRNLLTNYAKMPAAYIDYAKWTAEADAYMPTNYSAIIVEPTPVKELINRLCAESPSVLYWNEQEDKVVYDVLKAAPQGSSVLWTDDNFLSDAVVSVSHQTDLRKSTVIVNYDMISPVEDTEDSKNYRQCFVKVDADSARRYNGQRIETINCMFLSAANEGAARFAADLVLGRFSDVPKQLTVSVDPKDVGDAWTGDCIYVEHHKVQTDDGGFLRLPYQILSVADEGERFTYKMLQWFDPPAFTLLPIILNSQMANLRTQGGLSGSRLTLRDLYDRLFYVNPAGRTVNVVIESNAVLGSDSPDHAALNIGSWPTNTTINITIKPGAYIVGKGGVGGVSPPNFLNILPLATNHPGTNGTKGGLAFYTRKSVNINNQGVIGGGGGGGGFGWYKVKRNKTTSTRGGLGSHGAGYQREMFLDERLATANASLRPPTLPTLEQGGAAPYGNISTHNPEWMQIGGKGGDLGQAGQAGRANYYDTITWHPGGAAGGAIDGNSYISFSSVGTILGSRIN